MRIHKSEVVHKQEILAQIRRLAEQNNGVPPGSQSFAKQTGIPDSKWNGVYWARWGDAVEEAGFIRNTIQRRVPDDVLLAALCRIIRQLGHFPTRMEVRLCCKQDRELPSPWPILRLGKKREVIARVIDYCSPRPELADVLSICDHGAAGEKSPAFVYLFHNGGRHKIGRSIDVERRAKEIDAHVPATLEIVHTIETDDPVGVEAYWQNRFERKRIKGEWFKLTAADVAAFKRWKVM